MIKNILLYLTMYFCFVFVKSYSDYFFFLYFSKTLLSLVTIFYHNLGINKMAEKSSIFIFLIYLQPSTIPSFGQYIRKVRTSHQSEPKLRESGRWKTSGILHIRIIWKRHRSVCKTGTATANII